MNATPKTLWHQGQANPHVVYDEDNVMICNAGKAERAGQIVRAVNAFDAMREALEQAIARVELANREGHPILSAWLPDAKAALALAKGEQ